MLKNILNLEGALELTKSEQKTINGGKLPPPGDECDGNGFISPENSCLCRNGGQFIQGTFSCSNNQPTGRYWEIETGCCYSFN